LPDFHRDWREFGEKPVTGKGKNPSGAEIRDLPRLVVDCRGKDATFAAGNHEATVFENGEEHLPDAASQEAQE
jgi:hypothetical protein